MKTLHNCIETPGVIPNVMGGLGNQMFIVAAAHVVSKEQNIPLYIFQNPLTHQIANMHNLLKQDYNTSIFKYFGEHCSSLLTELEFLKFYGYTNHKPDGFLPWNPSTILPGTILSSYYQYWPTLQPYENELRILFLKGLEEYIKTVSEKYSFENAAFLHIRRGDYLKLPSFHYIQTIDDYYKPALDKFLLQKTPDVIYVLSDDTEWARQQTFFTDNPIFKIVDINNELEALACMSLCTAGAIIGNSTFSWWGAFLGAYSKKNPVFIPKRWIAEKIYCLFPEEWIII
jgi:hypothetical protein